MVINLIAIIINSCRKAVGKVYPGRCLNCFEDTIRQEGELMHASLTALNQGLDPTQTKVGECNEGQYNHRCMIQIRVFIYCVYWYYFSSV